MTDTRPKRGGAAAHLDEERLTAYVSIDLPDRDCTEIEHHLNVCDRCLDLLVIAHERVSLAAEVQMSVPATVVERAAAVATPATRHPAITAEPSLAAGVRAWLSAASERLAAFSRLPILVPASFAAGVALMFATQTVWLDVRSNPTTRAVNMHWTIRVTVPDAVVRTEPHPRAAIVGRVERGQVVEINEEDREWYRAVLPGGTEGWIERQAFE